MIKKKFVYSLLVGFIWKIFWIHSTYNAQLLEELSIALCSLSKEYLEAVGRCCSLLKSFKWNQQWFATFGLCQTECDEEAVAIAKNMPELRHLQLIGNQLTNDGLQAIFDGCPHLESLDLRKCFNVVLSGNSVKRCADHGPS